LSDSFTGSFIAPLSYTSTEGDISNRRLALLDAVAKTGSITAAAKAIGMTYKGAWDAIDAINNLTDTPLVLIRKGGTGGGGAELTHSGRQLLQRFADIAQAQQQFMAQLNQTELGDTYTIFKRFTMKTSARNSLYGEVTQFVDGAVNSEVTLQLSGGDSLTAIITKESVARLALTVGSKAYALIKSSWVLLAAGDKPLKTSARNQLVGTVSRITPGAVNTEVVLELRGGNTLAAIITHQSAQTLAIKVGDNMLALIKASHIILGTDD